jgi:SHS2 domain-containing protein
MKRYEFSDHTADVKMHAYGSTQTELLGNAMHGMFSQMETEHAPDAAITNRTINVTSSAFQFLLVDFLSECLYLADIHNEVYTTCSIHIINDRQVTGQVSGYPITACHGVEIKAITYHVLSVTYNDGMWQATIVFDI